LNKSLKYIAITICLLIFCIGTFSQNRKYLYGGIQISDYRNKLAFNYIINDFNNYHQIYDVNTTHRFCLPDYILGYTFGYKIHARFSEFGGNIYFNKFSSLAEGKEINGTEYYKKLIVTYNGFHLFYRILPINTNFLRTGPGIGLKIEQFKAKIDLNKEEVFNSIIPTSKALISGQVNYYVSIGGPKFNFDIGIFLQVPFWQIELDLLNYQLNEGYAVSYDDGQLNFNSILYGITFTIGLGSKENYHF